MMSKRLGELANAVLVLAMGSVISKKFAGALLNRIFETTKDASSGDSPDSSKNDGTGCTLVFA